MWSIVSNAFDKSTKRAAQRFFPIEPSPNIIYKQSSSCESAMALLYARLYLKHLWEFRREPGIGSIFYSKLLEWGMFVYYREKDICQSVLHLAVQMSWISLLYWSVKKACSSKFLKCILMTTRDWDLFRHISQIQAIGQWSLNQR